MNILEPVALDLAPAKWIWFPSERTLANTFVLFRRELRLAEKPVRATGWIAADSRYRLTLNGERLQWGPAPCDPRSMDVDPLDLTKHLKLGLNVLGVEVLYFGMGDATWMMGKPGLIVSLEIEFSDGRVEKLTTDRSWQAHIDRAHRPGQHRRWYLRALQEEFDAQLHPHQWDTPGFIPDSSWMPAYELNAPADKPPLAGRYTDYAQDINTVDSSTMALRTRQIPLLKEFNVAPLKFSNSGTVRWLRDPRDWFDFRVPHSFEINKEPIASALKNDGCVLPANHDRDGTFATFEFEEGLVGWPGFTIDAAAGTIVEIMVREGHNPEHTAWLDSSFFCWTRLICREGLTNFETYDYEALRWIQFHVRNAARPVTISRLSVRRRMHDWPTVPHVTCSEPALQRLFNAGLNTVRNSAHDIVGEVSRERQQYPGDAGCLLQTARYAFGDRMLSRRYLRTFAEGQTQEGYFLDCWPAVDRLNRIPQRLLGLTQWGPQLDLGGCYLFDCWNYYQETGDLEALREPLPHLIRFGNYILGLSDPKNSGLLPVENLGVPVVWMEHTAYRQQRHKQCSFNLYMAAALQHALAPLLNALGVSSEAAKFTAAGLNIQQATVAKFWDKESGLFVNNLPWLQNENSPRFDDRSLANAILFNQCPGDWTKPSADLLEKCPAELGLSYPCNSGWRYAALAKTNRIEPVLKDFRERWARMDSVRLNNTLQENWEAEPDTREIWTHNNPVPNNILFEYLAGITPLAPGYARYQIKPQLGDLESLEFTAHLAVGALTFKSRRTDQGHHVSLELPENGDGELNVPEGSDVNLESLQNRSYRLPQGKRCEFFIPRTLRND